MLNLIYCVNGKHKRSSFNTPSHGVFGSASTKFASVGNFVSKSDGQPIIGATILEQGTTNGTITDFDGKFSFKL